MNGPITKYSPLPVRHPVEMDTVPAENRWMIEMLWSAQAVGWIAGTPKAGKSWLGLDMAVSIASGRPCLDHFAVKQPGPALIYLAEDAMADVRRRLDAICAHKRIDIAKLDLHVIDVPSLRLDFADDFRRLVATVEAYRPRFLLLDPLVRLHRADENNAQEVASLLARLRDLQRQHELAITLVHHTRKAAAGQPGQGLRGSSDLHAWSDSALYLLKRKGHTDLVIEHRAAPAPEPLKLQLCLEPAHLEVVDAPDERKPSLDQRAMALLQRATQPMRRTAIRTQLQANNEAVGDALLYLEKLGRVTRTPQGWTAP